MKLSPLLCLLLFTASSCRPHSTKQTSKESVNKHNHASEILDQLPASHQIRGNSDIGEIEISSEESPTEVTYEDPHIAVLKDKVIFPNKTSGTYLRIIEKASFGDGVAGVVIVPRIDDNFVLIKNYRHPTRSWETEFPRGFCDAGLSPEENAKRETQEELGVEVSELRLLGTMKPNSGLLASTVHIFEAKLLQKPHKVPTQAESEAISSYEFVTKQEMKLKIQAGEIADGFTLSAWALINAQ